ncbi:MAG TPA: hypothetical protein VGG39_27710 [Polyangiaceae bacterium]
MKGARSDMRGTLYARIRFSAIGVAGAVGVAACSGSSGGDGGAGSASLSGTVNGATFSVASEVAALDAASTTCSAGGTSGDDGGAGSCTSTGQEVVVILTNRSDATCSAAQTQLASGNEAAFANFAELELLVANVTADVAAGTYDVVNAGSTATEGSLAKYGTTDASCASSATAQASGGSVTLTAVSASRVTGSYQLTFGTEGSFSGSFDVPICNLPDAGGNGADAGAPACLP